MFTIANQIRMRLKEKNLSVLALEKLSGLRRGAVQNIISGKSSNPTIYTLQAISKVLGCTIIDLIDENNTTNNNSEKKNYKEEYKEKITHLFNKINLTEREQEVLKYLSEGRSIKEIAMVLCLSPRTVEFYVNNLKLKTGSFSKSQLLKFFREI